jgi:hypothetical protein
VCWENILAEGVDFPWMGEFPQIWVEFTYIGVRVA